MHSTKDPASNVTENGTSGQTLLRLLCSIIIPETGDETATPEIQANVTTLLDQLAKSEGEQAEIVRMSVTRAIHDARDRGQPSARSAVKLVEKWETN